MLQMLSMLSNLLHVFQVLSSCLALSKTVDYVSRVMSLRLQHAKNNSVMEVFLHMELLKKKHFITLQKQGPGPGEYEIKDVQPVPIRSSFISKVPRILPAHTVSIILKMAQAVLAAIGLTWGSCLSWRHSIFSLWICSFLFWVWGGGNLIFSRYKGKHGDSKCYLDSDIIKLHPWK